MMLLHNYYNTDTLELKVSGGVKDDSLICGFIESDGLEARLECGRSKPAPPAGHGQEFPNSKP